MTNKESLVTVLMPCYNGREFVAEAVKSIINQSFTDWELLVVDDGSTDGSVSEIEKLRDSRVRVVRRPRYGLVASLNYGLDHARGKYVARMDADDVSLRERLERQVAFMESNRGLDVCGTWFQTIGMGRSDIKSFPTDSASIKGGLLFGCALCHPSVIMRRSSLEKYKLRYDLKFEHGEDYEFWTRVARFCEFANLPEVLLLHRDSPLIKSRAFADELQKTTQEVQRRQLRNFGVSLSAEELKLHWSIGGHHYQMSEVYLEKTEKWLVKLTQHNDLVKFYAPREFRGMVGQYWFSICLGLAGLGPPMWDKFNSSPLRHGAAVRISELASLWAHSRPKIRIPGQQVLVSMFRRFIKAPEKKKKKVFYQDPVVLSHRSLFEVDNWVISDFVLEKLVPVVGTKPYPLSELQLMTAAVCRLKPSLIFEWGTHKGVSARVFYEICKGFNISCEIHSTDLPPGVAHPEHPGKNWAELVRGLDISLHRGDGLDVSLGLLRKRDGGERVLFFLDGDHMYRSVIRELKAIAKNVPGADILIHDTFYLKVGSGCNNGPYRAVRDFLEKGPHRYSKISTETGRPGMTLLHWL